MDILLLLLQDSKTAIRFLRKHANVYGIDPNRVCFGVHSSGGNTAMLVAMTEDDPRYKTHEYAEYPDSVSVAGSIGPTDLVELFANSPDSSKAQNIWGICWRAINRAYRSIKTNEPLSHN